MSKAQVVKIVGQALFHGISDGQPAVEVKAYPGRCPVKAVIPPLEPTDLWQVKDEVTAQHQVFLPDHTDARKRHQAAMFEYAPCMAKLMGILEVS